MVCSIYYFYLEFNTTYSSTSYTSRNAPIRKGCDNTIFADELKLELSVITGYGRYF